MVQIELWLYRADLTLAPTVPNGEGELVASPRELYYHAKILFGKQWRTG